MQLHKLKVSVSAKSAGTGKDILIVEDEDTIREVIRRYLELDGFTVREAADGYAALDEVEEKLPDLIIMDLMLPGVDGLTLTRQFQRHENIPIIMLTAKSETSDRVRGLDLGADDYIVKPFSPRELISRVQAVLRRSHIPDDQPLSVGDIYIEPRSRSVKIAGEEVGLTSKEFDLLWFLARHPKQVFTRFQLLDNVWGYDFMGDPSTVTVHMRRLREKTEKNPSKPHHLVTVWGVGYRFDD
jgi:DNA-binding response OmpR family regulator